MKVRTCFIPQDAIEQKKLEKQQKLEDDEAAKKAKAAKKNAKIVVDSLTNPLLLFEEETRKQEAKGPSYLLDSAHMLLARVKVLVASATQSMLGGDGAIEWDMDEIKLAKSEMIAKMRTS
jgi:hypothetical protein